MSFDKGKAMRTAERFLSQGKIRAAISEYKRIVENDPRDFSTLNTLGDLYAKGNEEREAVGCFKQVAEHYSKQGFAQKAIAIYNKISRLQPNSADVSAKLAQLYQMKGSFAEARSHYVALAEQYQRKGQNAEALEIWKQIAKLDPNNTEVYLKIADFCLQNDQKDEATKAFTEAGVRLSNLNQLEPALKAFSRALEIRQYDLNALNGYVKTQVKLGYADEAAKTLEKILEQQPYNREILYLLVDCYIDINNPAEAEKAVIRLVEQEPANYPKFLQLVEVYIQSEDLDSAVRILSMSSEHLLVGGKPDEFLKWTNEILARNPEQLDALRLLVRYYGWQRDESELRSSLERLAEIARLKEAVEDERYALSQLILILPHEIAYAKRLQEINYEFGGQMSETPAAAAASGASEFQATEIPTFESFTVLDSEPAKGDGEYFAGYGQYESEIGLDATEEAFIYDESNFQHVSLDGRDDFSTIGDDFALAESETAADFSGNGVSGLKPADEIRLGQDIESIEFYIAQGYKDLAAKTLSGLEAEFGDRPEFAELREQMDDSLQKLAEKTTPQVEVLEAENLTPKPRAEVVRMGEKPGSFDFLNDFRHDLGFEESEPDPDEGDYETHYQTAIAYKEMGLMEDSIREFQDAVNLVRPDDGTRRFFQCCNLLGLCFMESGMPNLALMWYRRALETPRLTDEEKQALMYETGNAYEIGGEKPKALEYFEQVYAENVDYRDVSVRLENLRGNNSAL